MIGYRIGQDRTRHRIETMVVAWILSCNSLTSLCFLVSLLHLIDWFKRWLCICVLCAVGVWLLSDPILLRIVGAEVDMMRNL
jgi:hypothetical protein